MLPDAVLEAFPSDTYQKLGGIASMAGVDLELTILPRKIVDHPWVGLDVTFPFPEVGTGKIMQCITSPRGHLLFDVEFPMPVPPINEWGPMDGEPGGCEVLRAGYHSPIHRFYGASLKGVINGEYVRYTTTRYGRRVRM